MCIAYQLIISRNVGYPPLALFTFRIWLNLANFEQMVGHQPDQLFGIYRVRERKWHNMTQIFDQL